jgi:hypothetical protein
MPWLDQSGAAIPQSWPRVGDNVPNVSRDRGVAAQGASGPLRGFGSGSFAITVNYLNDGVIVQIDRVPARR